MYWIANERAVSTKVQWTDSLGVAQVAALASSVVVHGAFVDGSGWDEVYGILKKDGYQVSIVQHPTISLADDVAATRRVIAEQKSPVVLVGHSYGGAVITQAGTDPAVASLIYIAAFAPDRGESVGALIKDPAPGDPVPPIVPQQDRFLLVDKAKFPDAFAGDLPKDKAAALQECIRERRQRYEQDPAAPRLYARRFAQNQRRTVGRLLRRPSRSI